MFIEPANEALLGLLQLGLFFRGNHVGQGSPLSMDQGTLMGGWQEAATEIVEPA